MALKPCKECKNMVAVGAKSCPHCGTAWPAGRPTSPAAWGCLAIIILIVVASLNSGGGGGTGRSLSGAPSATPPAPPESAQPQLELVSWSWHIEYDYAIVEGQVKNISGESLRSVEAIASFSDKDGGFITSDDALIDYNPILPGQTSPFKVMARHNPAMKGASLDFKTLMGGSISWRQREKKKKAP